MVPGGRCRAPARAGIFWRSAIAYRVWGAFATRWRRAGHGRVLDGCEQRRPPLQPTRTTACRQARRWQDWLTDGRQVSARDRCSSSVSSSAVVKQRIGYRDIQALSRAQVSGQRFFYVTHSGGQYAITAFMLPSTAVFEEVCALLAAKMTCIRMG